MRILIAEKAAGKRTQVETILQKHGHQVVLATEGSEALKKYTSEKSDLVVLDWNLPGLKQDALKRRIKNCQNGTRPYTILISHDRKDQFGQMAFARADDYLITPCRDEEMINRIRIGLNLLHNKNEAKKTSSQMVKLLSEQDVPDWQMLSHLDRLATLGTLTATVIHEINNPLTYVQGSFQLLERLLRDTDEKIENYDHEKIKEIWHGIKNLVEEGLEGTGRMERLVVDFGNFARSGGSRETFSLKDAVDGAFRIMANRFKKGGIKAAASIDENILVNGSVQQLSQVFVNLVANSVEAFPPKGGKINVTAATEENSVTVTYTDSGPGLPLQNRHRIFEPFFTTKAKTGGSGLGMAIAQKIIQEHKGSIRAKNNPEGGALFQITLPLSKDCHKEKDENERL